MKKGLSIVTAILLLILLFLVEIGIIAFMHYKNRPYSVSSVAYKDENEKTINEIEYIETKTEPEIIEEETIEGKYNHDEYKEKIDEIAKKYGTVGLSIALVDNGKVIDTFSYGDAIKGELQMTEDTKIRIASISKVFLGIATMISVENGTMTLDEDIGNHWGFDIKTHATGDVITPRAILTHTSSLYDSEDVCATYYNNMAYRLRSGNGTRTLVSGNIDNFLYNNYAMDVLGMTIELANNKILDEILAERIYEKMGIDAVFYSGDIKDKSNVATLYQGDGTIGVTASRMMTWHSGKPGSVGWAFCRRCNNQCKRFGQNYCINFK